MILKQLNEIRIGKNVTILELSGITGINRNSLAKLMKGKTKADSKQLESICKALDCEIRILLKTQ